MYINCKFEALFKMLSFFERGQEVLLCNFFPVFHIDKNSANIEYIYLLPLKDLFALVGIKEKQKQIVSNIILSLKESIERKKCVILKTDLYAQEFSENFFNRKHFKHNVFIFGYDSKKDGFITFEHIKALSTLFTKQIFSPDEIKNWYTAYVDYYYKTKRDIAATYYEYSEIKKSYKDVNYSEMYMNLLHKKLFFLKNSQAGIIQFLQNIKDYSPQKQEEITLCLIQLKKILQLQFKLFFSENISTNKRLIELITKSINTFQFILVKIKRYEAINKDLLSQLCSNELLFQDLLLKGKD